MGKGVSTKIGAGADAEICNLFLWEIFEIEHLL